MKKFFTSNGRMNRLNYLFIASFVAIVQSVIFSIDAESILAIIISLAVLFFSMWIFICAAIKRFHDIDKSGNNLWLGFIPLYNLYIGGMLLFRKGTVGPNKYGDDPLRNEDSAIKQTERNEVTKIIKKDKTTGYAASLITICFIIVVLLIFIKVIIESFNLDNLSPKESVKIETNEPKTTEPKQITNPDYLKNPSAYVVDEKDIIISSPAGKTLWVEDVIDFKTLKVSYIIDKVGEKILKIQSMSILWLGDPAKDRLMDETVDNNFRSPYNLKCWKDGAREFLKNYILQSHSYVYLLESGRDATGIKDYMVKFTNGTLDGQGKIIYYDLAYNVIRNGYGVYALPQTSYVLDDRNILSDYSSELIDLEKVASLAKRGLWGTCQNHEK